MLKLLIVFYNTSNTPFTVANELEKCVLNSPTFKRLNTVTETLWLQANNLNTAAFDLTELWEISQQEHLSWVKMKNIVVVVVVVVMIY